MEVRVRARARARAHPVPKETRPTWVTRAEAEPG